MNYTAKILIERTRTTRYRAMLILIINYKYNLTNLLKLKVSDINYKALDFATRQALQVYVSEYNLAISDTLFPISRNSVWKMLGGLSKDLGLDYRLGLKDLYKLKPVKPCLPYQNIFSKLQGLFKHRELVASAGAIVPKVAERLIGREEEKKQLLRNKRIGKNTAIFGSTGVGKSALLQHLDKGKNTIYFDVFSPLKSCLVDLIFQLYQDDEINLDQEIQVRDINFEDKGEEEKSILSAIKRINTFALCRLASSVKTPKKYTLLIDNITSITSTFAYFFKCCNKTGAFTFFLVLDRATYRKNEPIFWKFDEVEIGEMRRENAKKLIKDLSYNLNLQVAYSNFEKSVLQISEQNPRAIVQLCEELQSRQVSSYDLLKLRHDKVPQYVDLYPFFALLTLSLMALRIGLMGMGDSEAKLIIVFFIIIVGVLKFYGRAKR